MKKILFVCHGNICRSPMAEFVLKDLVKKRGLEGRYEIASAATSREEIGNPVYPPARRKLAEHGISCAGHHARQMTKYDYGYYDLIVCMDHANCRNAARISGGDPENKIRLLLDFAGRPGQAMMTMPNTEVSTQRNNSSKSPLRKNSRRAAAPQDFNSEIGRRKHDEI